MKCTKCGNEILPGQAFCTTCGTPVSQMQNEVKNEVKKEVRNQNLGQDYIPPKKKSGMPVWAILLILTLVIVIVVGVCFIVITLVNADDDDSSSRKKRPGNDLANNTTNSITNDVTNNTIPTKKDKDKNKKVISVNDGFVAKIPDDYKYKMSTDGVSITDKSETMLINLQIKEYPYETIIAKREELASKMRQSGATISKMEEKTVNGTPVFVYEVNVTGYNSIIALVKIDASNTALVEVIDSDYTTYNYSHLEKAVEIAVTVEKSTDGSTTTSTDENATITNLESKSSIDYGSLLDE